MIKVIIVYLSAEVAEKDFKIVQEIYKPIEVEQTKRQITYLFDNQLKAKLFLNRLLYVSKYVSKYSVEFLNV